MAGRALGASIQGAEKARKTLERRNLSQKILSERLGLSWATVNKFFNRKPIDRQNFLHICAELNLDGDEIVGLLSHLNQPEEPQTNQDLSVNNSEELNAVQQCAQQARLALDPYILPRIRRTTILEKCLKAIGHGVKEQKRRVIPILGAAGSGKSTILGTIYDELIQELDQTHNGWIALIRCNDLIESVETFATELGEKACGQKKPITELAATLTQKHNRGVLLLDTLDLVLDKRLIPVLRQIWLQLLASGTTVVFTCRDQDFRDFFEPYHESFAGFTESIERCEIGQFEDEEVKAAAIAFVERELADRTLENATDFADKIIALSADSQSLKDITRNPLLLALLCKLFAEEGNIPEDLTVSQLYEIYWNLRIAQGRRLQTESRLIGMAKKTLCLTLAQMMYNRSRDRLRDFVFESDLEFDEQSFLAYTELKSDGVIQDLGGDKLGFFHQTFLEYAIARWLDSTEAGAIAKQQLLDQLSTRTTAYLQNYIWPVVRQLLSLTHLPEFYQIAHRLDTRQLPPFRAVTFAAVSRTEPEAAYQLQQLLPLAFTLGDAYTDIILTAIRGAPARHGEVLWSVVLELLSQTRQTLANKAAEITGELLTRLPPPRGDRMVSALQAVRGRSREEADLRSHLFGKLIGTYIKMPKRGGIDLDVLPALKEHYFRFGGLTRWLVLEFYLATDVPDRLKRDLLMAIIQKPTSEQFKERDSAVALLKQTLPNLIKSGDSPFGKSWIEALYAPLPADWDLIQAAAVGAQAAHDPQLLDTLIQPLFPTHQSPTDGQLIRRHHVAIGEAIKNGAGNAVAAALLNIPLNTVSPNRFSTISQLLRELNNTGNHQLPLAPNLVESLAQWLSAGMSDRPLQLIPLLDILAHTSPQVEQLVGELLSELIPKLKPTQINSILKKLNHIPPSIESYLESTATFKESRQALLKLYQRRYETERSPESVSQLLKFCLDDSREIALSTSKIILTWVEKPTPIAVTAFFSILELSRFLGVRHNCLKAVAELIKTGCSVTESELLRICTILADEQAPELIQPLYKIIECWVQVTGAISPTLAETTFQLTQKQINHKQDKFIDSGIAQSAFITLKNIANLEHHHLSSQLCECTRQLLRATDINRAVHISFAIGLLDKLGKLNPEFLGQIVREDFIREDNTLPIANMDAVVIAIGHSQGKKSPLLAEILDDERFPQEVKNLILREQGI
ncbi:MAG TPA: hypothetical protein DDZ80_18480 [Cyanobacteria bacterium UBA8803]|nr:hypothetical protein [Cyanobacteria bacterium UBA8803]